MKDLEYGLCIGCERILPMSVLKQVKYHKYHEHKGSFHHKLMCLTCIKMADEAGVEILKDKRCD